MAEMLVDTDDLVFLIGQKEIEKLNKDKTLGVFEKRCRELETGLNEVQNLKDRNALLKESNKTISNQSVALDQALTEARKKIEEVKKELDGKSHALTAAQKMIEDVTKARDEDSLAATKLVTQQQETIAGQKKTIADLNEAIAEKEKTIADLKARKKKKPKKSSK